MGKQYIADNFIKSGGTSGQFLMADGSTSTGTTGGGSITGSPNKIAKFNPTGDNVINSSLTDDGINILSTSNLFFTSGSNRTIGVNNSFSGNGKDLTISASSTDDISFIVGTGNTENFVAYNEPKDWNSLDGNSYNNLLYGSDASNQVWVSSDNGVNWVADEAPFANGCGVSQAPNGDVYVGNGIAVYKQTGGVGSFNLAFSLGECYYTWVAPNGYVYLCTFQGGIYFSIDDGASFNLITGTDTNSFWRGMYYYGGDIYACSIINNDGIYKQTGQAGAFVLEGGITNRFYNQFTVLDNDVYATVNGDNIFKRTNNTGDFNTLSQVTRSWNGICSLNGDLFAVVGGDNLYISVGGNVYPNYSGGTLNLQAGNGVGAGSSVINFITSSPETLNTLQTGTVKMTLDGNGDLTLNNNLYTSNLYTTNLVSGNSFNNVSINAKFDGSNIFIGANVESNAGSSGGQMVIIGDNAGLYDAGFGSVFIGSNANQNNTNTTHSVVIGRNSKTGGDNGDNEVVIGGFDATGNGSFTNTIGTSTSSDTYLMGNIRGNAGLKYTYGIDISNQELNDLNDGGFYSGTNLLSSPLSSTDLFFITVQRYTLDDSFVHQVATRMGVGGNQMFTRTKDSGVWGAWYQFTLTLAI